MIDVLYEDNHIIAVNKKPSDIVQGDKTGDKPLSEFVKLFLKKKYNKPGNVFVGVAHRIDRPVSGVILFAKTSKALSRLNEQFREKKIQKTYWAVVKNKPEMTAGNLIHFLKKNQQKNKSFAQIKEGNGALKSELSYQIIKELNSFFLLEVLPKTGRHHQIRVQLSKIGSPIKGDIKYGFNRTNKDASIHLHARKIEFIHPIQKTKTTIIAPPPASDPIWKACI
jgi:23S rRNA pseudouridine1911/1915/1917 synthase